MAATASILKKNLFNKARHRKAKLFSALLNETHTESYPNGNCGYQQGVIYALCDLFPECVHRRVSGDPHSMGHVTFDTSKLSTNDETLISRLILMADGLPVDDNNPRAGWKAAYAGADYVAWKKRRSVWQDMQAECRGYYSRLPEMVSRQDLCA